MTQSKRGFAAMDPERQREIARAGGRASHERGSAHEWNAQEAAKAGRAAHARGHAHEWTSAEAAEAGRRGGRAGRRRRLEAQANQGEARPSLESSERAIPADVSEPTQEEAGAEGRADATRADASEDGDERATLTDARPGE